MKKAWQDLQEEYKAAMATVGTDLSNIKWSLFQDSHHAHASQSVTSNAETAAELDFAKLDSMYQDNHPFILVAKQIILDVMKQNKWDILKLKNHFFFYHVAKALITQNHVNLGNQTTILGHTHVFDPILKTRSIQFITDMINVRPTKTGEDYDVYNVRLESPFSDYRAVLTRNRDESVSTIYTEYSRLKS